MVHIHENFDLKPFNTFGIAARARFFATVSKEEQFFELLQSPVYQDHSVLILGGGSNILFTHDFEGLVIQNDIKCRRIVHESGSHVDVEFGAGEVWHECVMDVVGRGWGGIENLSLIPGTVGAAPMQNIGAYGVEVKDVIKEVRAIDRRTGAVRTFTNEECEFGYRESVFKHALKEKFFISSVTLTLTTKDHRLNTSYGAIDETLKRMNVTQPTIHSISDAVIAIRQSKLPDPRVIGNAGSFFKNPTVKLDVYNTLKQREPSIPGYISENQEVKVPAGWLIEQCGWKGKRFDDVGVHANQALVLVNYGDAKGEEVFQLSKDIQSSVVDRFGITLQVEVNIV